MTMIVRMKGIKKATAKGRTYYYHRRTGERILADPNTDPAAFVAQVHALDKKGAPAEDKIPGTWGDLVLRYRLSPEWRGLAPRTRADYDKVFNYLARIDDRPLTAITSPRLIALRDKAFDQRGWRFSGYLLTVIQLVFNWGKPRGLTADNPAAGVPRIRRPRTLPDANRPWEPDEIAAVLRRARWSLLVPLTLALCTLLRRGDVVTYPWTRVRLERRHDGRIVGELQSRNAKTGKWFWMPVIPLLGDVLARTPPRDSTLIVVNAAGRPFDKDVLTKEVGKFVRSLERDGLVRPGLTLQGLRHTGGTILAEEGVDPRTIQKLLNHSTIEQTLHYVRRADQKALVKAGTDVLSERLGNISLENRTDWSGKLGQLN